MRAISDILPASVEIEKEENYCRVTLNTNIKQETISDENGEHVEYTYDTYTENQIFYEGLQNEIEAHFNEFLEEFINLEIAALSKPIREKRNKLLADTDWTQMKDADLDEAAIDMYQTYRQELRDITDQPNFPYEVDWPVLGG